MKKIICFVTLLLLVLPHSLWAENDDVKKEFALKSLIFDHEDYLPYEFSCWVTQLNPPLVIENPPEKTRSFVLTMHDESAVEGEWTHWVVYNIPPNTRLIESGIQPGDQALNDFGEFNYHAPCPSDEKPHRYVFNLYALKSNLYEVEGATRKDILKELRGKVLKHTQLIAIYENPKW